MFDFRGLRRDIKADYDAPVVARMKAAGRNNGLKSITYIIRLEKFCNDW